MLETQHHDDVSCCKLSFKTDSCMDPRIPARSWVMVHVRKLPLLLLRLLRCSHHHQLARIHAHAALHAAWIEARRGDPIAGQ